jgi:hypothetical protein
MTVLLFSRIKKLIDDCLVIGNDFQIKRLIDDYLVIGKDFQIKKLIDDL